MTDASLDALGPVEYVVVEFRRELQAAPGRPVRIPCPIIVGVEQGR
jgi:hypothetical protein